MMPSRTVAEGPYCGQPDVDPDTWFDVDRRAEAIAGCKRCPLRAECLVTALKQPVFEASYGVWGGMIPAQRHKFQARYPNVTVSHTRELLAHLG